MVEPIKKAVIGIKRMGVIFWCTAAICYVTGLAKPSDGEIPTAIIISAMTLVAAMGGVDVWKQGRGE